MKKQVLDSGALQFSLHGPLSSMYSLLKIEMIIPMSFRIFDTLLLKGFISVLILLATTFSVFLEGFVYNL